MTAAKPSFSQPAPLQNEEEPQLPSSAVAELIQKSLSTAAMPTAEASAEAAAADRPTDLPAALAPADPNNSTLMGNEHADSSPEKLSLKVTFSRFN